MSGEQDEDMVDPSVNFLFKTMMQRDPRKRQVKLVPKHLVQVDFDMGDSEEDSDFDIGEHKVSFSGSDSGEEMGEEEQEACMELGAAEVSQSSSIALDKLNDDKDDGSSDSEDGSENESDDDDSDGDNEDEDEDEDEDDSESEADDQETPRLKPKGLGGIFDGIGTSDEEDEDYVPQKKKKKKSAAPKLAKAKSAEISKVALPVVDSPVSVSGQGHGQIKVLICCVCLSDQSADDDEIVECDNCGISVHEGCYGISESQSVASTESSASTEPWFCDACKAGVLPHCELCPNSGGIYKETDAGKWVHIVCALYTPGVAFGDVDRLCPVTLFEMQYSKWGAKECSLCEDARYSRTGVCISCDAGMCRSFFHVTCAQREGLLTEADPGEVMDIADPFFAYCKQHVDKMTMKARRRHWLAIQSHIRSYMPKVMDDQKEQMRFERKLNRHREKYIISRNKRPPSWVPTQKMVRHLHTSPYAVKAFMRKAELMGVVTHVEQAQHEKPEARKKPHITPALSAEFIQYYFGRNTKIDQLRNNLNELTTQNVKLRDQERVIRTQYDQLSHNLTQLREATNTARREGEKLCEVLSDIGGKSVTVPEMFRPKKRQRSPSKKETPCSPSALIHQCGICNQTTDQHLLAKCDSCRQHFHLGCLDPPLTRMPKKSKLFGWQCSQCVSSSSDDSDGSAGAKLVDEPRRLRETIKEPIKYRNQQLEGIEMKKKLSGKGVKKKKRTPLMTASGDAGAKSPTPLSASVAASTPGASSLAAKSHKKGATKKEEAPKERTPKRAPSPVPRAKKEEPVFQCVVCNIHGDASDTVRCDECLLSYHFYCLDPPVKKSPKVRGYAWHCEACDPTDMSDVYLVEDEEPDNKAAEGPTNTSGTTEVSA
ncbi:PHD finger protein 14-like isoform X2 [Littorina saxatilis]|uniref:PHD finger protein 14-like isoform X2 n=1 Tax=Littorina saxatilis TaxID=31220 RepID=UPI0038B541E8